MNWDVPLMNLKLLHEKYKDEMLAEINNVVDSCIYCNGKVSKEFARDFAHYHGDGVHAVTCANATDALCLCLQALKLNPGDEVITVSHCVVCDVEAIIHAGAKPVLIDINPENYVLDETRLEECITPKTRAVVAVHLYGHPCNLAPLVEICKKHNLYLIEDCAQALGTKYKNVKVGTIGDLGFYSFYPSKNMGAMGDAGAVIGKNKDLIETIGALSNHGRKTNERYAHQFIGKNSRMDELQAAILKVKLKYLDQDIEKRRTAAQLYTKLLKEVEGVIPPSELEYATHSYHLYVIRTKRRDELKQFLKERRIQTEIHYPICIHLQPAYENFLKERVNLDNSETISKEVLSLPLFPGISSEQIYKVVNSIKEFCGA